MSLLVNALNENWPAAQQESCQGDQDGAKQVVAFFAHALLKNSLLFNRKSSKVIHDVKSNDTK